MSYICAMQETYTQALVQAAIIVSAATFFLSGATLIIAIQLKKKRKYVRKAATNKKR